MQLNIKYKYHLSIKISFILLVATAIFVLPSGAYAQAAGGAQALEQVLCQIIGWFTGYVGKGIATLAIISLGLGALFGKLDPGRGIVIVCGIAFMFGAASILEALQLPGLTVTTCPTASESGKQIADALCRVALWLQTDVGKAIMITAVMVLGIMSLFGKVSFGIGTMLVAGIGIIAGANEIADKLASSAGGTEITCAHIVVGFPPF